MFEVKLFDIKLLGRGYLGNVFIVRRKNGEKICGYGDPRPGQSDKTLYR